MGLLLELLRLIEVEERDLHVSVVEETTLEFTGCALIVSLRSVAVTLLLESVWLVAVTLLLESVWSVTVTLLLESVLGDSCFFGCKLLHEVLDALIEV